MTNKATLGQPLRFPAKDFLIQRSPMAAKGQRYIVLTM